MAPGARLTPMAGGIAEIVPPNTWRVIGDRIRDDEAYIPMNQSRRSMDILATTAARMGQSITPRRTAGMASGAVARPGAASPTISPLVVWRTERSMARASAAVSTAMSSLRMAGRIGPGPVVAGLRGSRRPPPPTRRCPTAQRARGGVAGPTGHSDHVYDQTVIQRKPHGRPRWPCGWADDRKEITGGAKAARKRAIADGQFGSGTPVTWYTGMSTAISADDGTGFLEPAGGAYARVAVTNNATNFPAATTVTGTTTKKCGVNVLFPVPTTNWGLMREIGWFLTLTGGLPEWSVEFDEPRDVRSGNTVVEVPATLLVMPFT